MEWKVWIREINYTEDDQERIDIANYLIKDYEQILVNKIKSQTRNEQEITRRFIGDPQRQLMIKSKADLMAMMVPTYTTIITK